ncbi:Phospholipid:diacylglycerol acyltransferase [Seminavis robusta]|uniref:Phospholipid:diacylglycerol acyltransferase n=1 Tax=Seminavis robusta TaxID=568900 RepID=A0A9N8HIE9_9STRA|nr:Phospholipid:diacylglycerol acyltransferase [Seminavis robusta]|eukprot:Sro496_g154590.1 Phospholipid:diacylglycerol acyltransferase (757) ;mRNA; f:20427-22697
MGRNDGKRAYLPILIIPGFMSSGLEVVESQSKTEWEGKRIWLNLSSLGFQTTFLRSAKDDYKEAPDEGSSQLNDPRSDAFGDPRSAVLRNAWLHHMSLQKDMVTERDGVRVRNISGLAGVDYLTPGALLNYVSYVFGPMILALQQVGYKDGQNLDAAPYDWRLPPCALETRDSYFTRTMGQIEKMYKTSRDTPVVLVCHSMGCKVGHYLLNFAKQARGQEWIDKHIHTYCPIGAPHLGAPKALRSLVCGDKMGLDTFLSDAEALVLGRSLGSAPFLVPEELPDNATPLAILRMDGAIEVTVLNSIDTDVFLSKREAGHAPGKVKVTVVFGGSSLTTPYNAINERQRVHFYEDFTFRTEDKGPKDRDKLTIFLCEPGVSSARRSVTPIRQAHLGCRNCFFSPWKANFCGNDAKWAMPSKENKVLFWLNILFFWWLIYPIVRYSIEFSFKIAFGVTYGVFWCLISGTVMSADEFSKVSGGSSVLAMARIPHVRRELFPDSSARTDKAKQVDMDIDLVSYRDMRRICGWCYDKRRTKLRVRIKWIPPQSLPQPRSKCRHIIAQPTEQTQSIKGVVELNKRKKKKKAAFTARSGYDILRAEGLFTVFDHMDQMYAKDPLDPRGFSSKDAPPARVIKAIYGVNLPTEVGAIFKRLRASIGIPNHVRNLLEPDCNAVLKLNPDGVVVKNGCIYETNAAGNKSGDGTVPYWSLSHVRTWERDCQVTVDEIEGAEHREILADKRLHQLLIDYCCAKYAVPEDTV